MAAHIHSSSGPLILASYNSTGMGQDKRDYVRELLTNHCIDIMLLQETWLQSKNMATLGGIDEHCAFHGISGVNENELLAGRPYGGVGFLWKKSLSRSVKRVAFQSKRVCALSVDIGMQSPLLLIVICPVIIIIVLMLMKNFLML